MKKRIYFISLITAIFVALVVGYNNCGPYHFKSYGTETTNPMAPVSNELMYGICGVINRCNPQVTIDNCQQALLTTSGFAAPLGLSTSYNTFSTIIQGETSEALTGNLTAASGCYDSINTLSCSDPAVVAAYNSSLSNPFVNSASMVLAPSCNQVFTPGVNLEVPIELVDYGLSSNTTSVTFSRTRTSLNSTDYDGTVTYSFETVASNMDSVPRNISLVNSTGTTLASILVPSGTGNPTRFRVAFSPTSGVDDYRIKLDGTTSVDQLSAFAGRVLVKQVGATQTKIYIPLTSYFAGTTSHGDDSTGAVDVSVYGGVYGQNTPYAFALWNKNSSAFSQLDPTSPYTFEAVISGTNSAYTSLFDYKSGLQVSASEVSTASTTPALVTASFSDSAPNFINLDDIEVRLKNGGPSTNSWIYRSGLWVKLINLAHAEVYYRYSLREWQNTPTGDNRYYWNPVLLNLSLFTAPTVYNEATGYSFAAGTQCIGKTLDIGTADSASNGTAVATSTLTFSTAQRVRLRSPALSLISNDRFIGDAIANPTSNVCTIPQSTLVVGF